MAKQKVNNIKLTTRVRSSVSVTKFISGVGVPPPRMEGRGSHPTA